MCRCGFFPAFIIRWAVCGLISSSERIFPDCFAAGECDYSIHGANRLGANSLVSVAFTAVLSPRRRRLITRKMSSAKTTETNGIHAAELKRQQEINNQIIKNEGGENQYKIHDELGKYMTDNVTVVRYNDRLQETDNKILELMDRFQNISINDSNLWATQAVPHARQLWNMLNLARVITLGALNRNESRGAHYKPEFPERNDDEWLKTTIAEYSEESPVFSYEAVDIGLIEPRKRDYSSGKKAAAAATEKGGAPQIVEEGFEQKPENTDRQFTVNEKDAQIKDGKSFEVIHEDKEEA